MEASATIISTLTSYLVQSPLFLVWLVGIVLAVSRWSQHPRVSLLTVIALAVLLLTSLINGYLNVQLPTLMSDSGWNHPQISLFFMIKGFAQGVIETIAFVLLLIAVFGWRTPQS